MSDPEASPLDADDELAAGTLVGEYVIEKLLGSGGMGEVYAARHPVIGKRVAIKVMNRHCSANPINVERFVQEAKAVNAIGHPNIVDIFAFGRTADARCFFVMEQLRGESVRERLQRGIYPLDAIEILDGTLRALEAAHGAGIVHRDLKPDNIFLVAARDGEPERVKLLDFGIAKLNDEGLLRGNSKTRTGTVVGTPNYMSPEQAGGLHVDCPSDVYSLGVVAFELLTGALPFEAEATVVIMAKHLSELPPVPSSVRATVTPGFDRLILSMLSKRTAERPTPGEVRARLVELRKEAQGLVPDAGAVVSEPTVGVSGAMTSPAKPVAILRAKPRAESSPSPKATTGPALDPTVSAMPVVAQPTPPSSREAIALSTSRTRMYAVTAAVIVAVIGGVLLYVNTRSRSDEPPASAVTTPPATPVPDPTPVPTPTPVPDPVPVPVPAAGSAAPAETAAAVTPPTTVAGSGSGSAATRPRRTAPVGKKPGAGSAAKPATTGPKPPDIDAVRDPFSDHGGTP